MENALSKIVKNDDKKKNALRGAIDGELKSPIIDSMLNDFLNNCDNDLIKKLEKGEPLPENESIRERMMQSMKKAVGLEHLDDKDDKEIVIIKKLKLNNQTFDQIFGHESEIPEMLSREHVITEDTDGIKINGKPITDINGLKPFLPEKMQKAFDAMIKNPKDQESMKKLNGEAVAQNLVLLVMDGLMKNSFGKDRLKALEASKTNPEKAPSLAETIRGWILLFTNLMKALKGGDLETAGEYLEGLKNPKELANKVEESKKSYGNILDKNKPQDVDVNDLLKAYLKPRGLEADNLFGKDGPSSKFRMEAKPAIENYLQKELGLSKISSIAELANGRTEINGYKGDGTHVAIEFFAENNKPRAEIKYYETSTENGKNSEKKQEKGKPVTEVAMANLKKEIAGAPSATPSQQPEGEAKTLDAKKKPIAENLGKMVEKGNIGNKLSTLGQIIKDLNLTGVPEAKGSQQKIDEARAKFIMDQMKTEDKLGELIKNPTYAKALAKIEAQSKAKVKVAKK